STASGTIAQTFTSVSGERGRRGSRRVARTRPRPMPRTGCARDAVNQSRDRDGREVTKPLRVGVVGCGVIAQVMHLPHLADLRDRFEVAALCDVSEPVAAA